MLVRDEQMQPGFIDFQTFAQGFGFVNREAFLGQRVSKTSTWWDFGRAVT